MENNIVYSNCGGHDLVERCHKLDKVILLNPSLDIYSKQVFENLKEAKQLELQP